MHTSHDADSPKDGPFESFDNKNLTSGYQNPQKLPESGRGYWLGNFRPKKEKLKLLYFQNGKSDLKPFSNIRDGGRPLYFVQIF